MAPSPDLVVRVTANIEELKRQLATGTSVIESTTKSVGRMVAAMDGNKVVQQAQNVVQALSQVDNIFTISARDAERYGRTVSRAIEVMETQGKAVPPAMREAQRALQGVASQAEKTGGLFGSLVTHGKNLLGLFGIGVGAGAVIAFGKSVIDLAADVKDLSTKMGLSVEATQRLQWAAKQVGADLSDVERAVGEMSKSLSGGDASANAALRKLGLSLEDLRTMAPEEAFRVIANAIATIPNQFDQVSIATAMFGKQYATVMGMIREGAIDASKSVAVMSDQTVEQLDRLQKAYEGFARDLKISIAEAYSFFADALSRMPPPTAGTGQAIGMALSAELARRMVDTTPPAIRGRDQERRPQSPLSALVAAAPTIDESTRALKEFNDTYDETLKKSASEYEAVAKEAYARSVAALEARAQALTSVVQYQAEHGWKMSAAEIKKVVNEIDGLYQAGVAVSKPLEHIYYANLQLVDSFKELKVSATAIPELLKQMGGTPVTLGPRPQTLQEQLRYRQGLGAVTINDQSFRDYDHYIRFVTDVQPKLAAQEQTLHTLGDAITAAGFAMAGLGKSADKTTQMIGQFGVRSMDVFNRYQKKLLEIARDQKLQQNEEATQEAKRAAGIETYVNLLGVASDAIGELSRNAKGAWKAVADAVQVGISALQTYIATASAAATATTVATAGIALIAGAMISAFAEARRASKQYRADLQAVTDELRAMGIEAQALQAYLAQHLRGSADRGADSREAQYLAALQRQLQAAKDAADKIKGHIGSVESLLSKFGGFLPRAFQPFMDQLSKSAGLTDDLRKALLGLSGEPSWEYLQQTAEQYGIAIDALGTKFQQTKLGATADEYYTHFTQLIEAGADANAVMDGMKDEIQTLMANAKKFGIALPSFMKPMLDSMAKAGYLLDENGNKLEDLSGYNFTDTIESSFQRMADLLEQIVTLLGGIPNQARKIANEMAGIKLPPPAEPDMPTPRSAIDISTLPPVSKTGSSVGHVQIDVNVKAWDGDSVEHWLHAGGARQLSDAILPRLADSRLLYGV